ncbi:unnamed protein product [Prorocentrum cordatum]|uniref:Uncharacterized protein n=1 Tax=Prorocentrum cordatum TaxID=2364126 RepID=A0ABN9SKV9_9DINO|nr:unnamed protein product [Polarella glacialis]
MCTHLRFKHRLPPWRESGHRRVPAPMNIIYKATHPRAPAAGYTLFTKKLAFMPPLTSPSTREEDIGEWSAVTNNILLKIACFPTDGRSRTRAHLAGSRNECHVPALE